MSSAITGLNVADLGWFDGHTGVFSPATNRERQVMTSTIRRGQDGTRDMFISEDESDYYSAHIVTSARYTAYPTNRLDEYY